MTNNDTNPDTFDVAIVGYGPTGLALAYWMGAAGHRTVVIERWPDLYALPRAGHVDGEVMRLFQKMGVAETIASESSVQTQTRVKDSEGNVLVQIPAETSDQGWASHYSLFQPHLEQTLDARVHSTGNVTVLQGWQAESITGGEGELHRIEIASGIGDNGRWIPTGKTRVVEAKWLVGADGANSVVAGTVTQDVEDLGYKARALVIFAERIDPTVGADMPDAEVGMLPSRPYVALRESGKRFARWEFLVDPAETTEEMSTEEKAWSLLQPWGFSSENSRLIRHTVFEFRTLLAREWRRGNALLAGDAAHRMPPHQGQGMCSGQRDALALAWRLDLVLRGIADERLLDSYTPERRPHVLAVTEGSVERAAQYWITDPDLARARDERMRAGLANANLMSTTYGAFPGLEHGVLFRDTQGIVPPAGTLSPQFAVRVRGEEKLLDDELGPCWSLLVESRANLEALDGGEIEVLRRIGCRIWALDEEGDPDDVHGSYGKWLAEIASTAVLIRPDSYIFGAAADRSSLQQLIASLAEQLHLTSTGE